jgi:hypothetical protein
MKPNYSEEGTSGSVLDQRNRIDPSIQVFWISHREHLFQVFESFPVSIS